MSTSPNPLVRLFAACLFPSLVGTPTLWASEHAGESPRVSIAGTGSSGSTYVKAQFGVVSESDFGPALGPEVVLIWFAIVVMSTPPKSNTTARTRSLATMTIAQSNVAVGVRSALYTAAEASIRCLRLTAPVRPPSFNIVRMSK